MVTYIARKGEWVRKDTEFGQEQARELLRRIDALRELRAMHADHAAQTAPSACNATAPQRRDTQFRGFDSSFFFPPSLQSDKPKQHANYVPALERPEITTLYFNSK